MKVVRKDVVPRYKRDNITSALLVSSLTTDAKNLTITIVEMEPEGIQRIHSHEQEQMYYIMEGKDETDKASQLPCMPNGSNDTFGILSGGVYL